MKHTNNRNQGPWGLVFRKNEDVVTRRIADELFIVPVKGRLADLQCIYTLNPVAEYIWDNLDSQRTVSDIFEGLIENFDVSRSEAEEDVATFLKELIDSGLIVEASAN